MAEQNKTSSYGRPLGPMITTIILSCLACCLFYQIWEREARLGQGRAEQQASIAALEARHAGLKKMLELSPCDARDALAKSGLQGVGAIQVSTP